MPLPTNPDGSLREFTAAEVAAMKIQTADVRYGDHPTMSRDGRTCTVTRPFYVLWEQVTNFVPYMLGGSVTYRDSDNVLRLSRLMPQTFPGEPGFVAIGEPEIKGAKSAGIDDVNGVPAYKCAKVTVRYEWVPFKLAPDSITLGDEQARYTEYLPSKTDAKMITLPGSTLNYINPPGRMGRPGGLPIPRNIGVVEPEQMTTWRWHRLPFECWGAGSPLYTLVYGNQEQGIPPWTGTVNKYPVYSRPAGTLLFLGVDEEVVPDPVTLLRCWNLNLVFLSRPVQHNWLLWADTIANADPPGYFFAGRGNTWYDAETLPDGVGIFNARDHNTLWAVGGQ